MSEPSAGKFEDGAHWLPVRVYYEDTDFTGVVYHANYLRWFERARSDLVRLLGIDQRAAQDAGEGAYAVADLAIRYIAPARLDDTVLLETRAEEVNAASCRLLQRAYRDGALLAEARVRVGFVGPDGRARRQPAAWRAALIPLLPTLTDPA